MSSPLARRLALALLPIGAAGILAAAPTWMNQTSGVMSTLRGVSAVNDHVAWASGSGSTVLHTVDAGATWQKIVVTPDRVDFRDVDAIDEHLAYVLSIGNGAASRIYKTTDAGATWTPSFLNDDPKVFLDAMSWWDASNGMVIGDSIDGQFCIMTTADAGKTWTRVPPASLPAAQPNEGAFAASGTNIAVLGQDAWIGTGAAATARVLHTPDRGKTWTVASTPLISGASAGIYSVAFRDARHGVVVGGDYKLEKDAVDNVAVTSDGGGTWTLVKEHALSGFRSVVAYRPGTPMSLVAIGPQGTDLSTDDGRTWTSIPGPGFHTFSFAPSGAMGWAAGNRGAVGRLDLREGHVSMPDAR
jgi:photosystem II stability/assembly factor-like uncharacterized protein